MRTIIAGSSHITDYSMVAAAVEQSGWHPTAIISGGARGVDTLGECWAKDNDVPIERFPADWAKHGKAAGYQRNLLMAEHAEALIAVWDGESRGTKHMIDIARRAGLQVHVHKVEQREPPHKQESEQLKRGKFKP